MGRYWRLFIGIEAQFEREEPLDIGLLASHWALESIERVTQITLTEAGGVSAGPMNRAPDVRRRPLWPIVSWAAYGKRMLAEADGPPSARSTRRALCWVGPSGRWRSNSAGR